MIIMSLALSEQCNLNCTYCNVDKLSKKKISPQLFLEEFKKKRLEHPTEIFQIDFYGGEPLLQWDSVQTIIEATKGEENLKYFMPTNGLLLNEERVNYLNEHNVSVSLSFDGLWQDENRKLHDGKESRTAFLAKKTLFKKLKKSDCHSMIYKDNLNLLENHLYIVNELGLNPNLTLVRDVGVWEAKDVLKFNLAFTELLEWYMDNVDSVEMPNLIKEYLRHIVLYTSKRVQVDFCGASETHFSFTENKLIPCNRFKEPGVTEKIPAFKKMKECQSCSVKSFCKKGCLYENIKNNGPILEICDMYRHIYSELLRMTKTLYSNESFKGKMLGVMNEC